MPEKDDPIKKDKSTGENRNGRKSQYKNFNPQQGEEPNEFLNSETVRPEHVGLENMDD